MVCAVLNPELLSGMAVYEGILLQTVQDQAGVTLRREQEDGPILMEGTLDQVIEARELVLGIWKSLIAGGDRAEPVGIQGGEKLESTVSQDFAMETSIGDVDGELGVENGESTSKIIQMEETSLDIDPAEGVHTVDELVATAGIVKDDPGGLEEEAAVDYSLAAEGMSIIADSQDNSVQTSQDTVKPEKGLKEVVTCCFCQHEFKSKADLAEHLIEKYCWESHPEVSETSLTVQEIFQELETIRDLKCSICNVSFGKFSTVARHLISRTCKNTKYTKKRVRSCTFSHKQFLQKHKATYDKATKKYSCGYCQGLYDRPHNLRRHIEREHLPKDIQCPECRKKYASEFLLHKHVHYAHKSSSSVVCDICGVQVKKTYLKGHMRTKHTDPDKQERHPCLQCDYVGTNESYLAKHVQLRHAEKRHICQQCFKGFGNKNALAKHVKGVHEGFRWNRSIHSLTKQPCPQCGVVMLKKNLTKHIMVAHQKVRNFPCDICGKKFGSRNGLDQHLMVHRVDINNKRVYRFYCDICTYGSNKLKLIEEHRLTAHFGQTIPKPHLCPICGRGFTVKLAMQKHLVLHEDESRVCDICSRDFKTTRILKLHMKKSHGLRARFTCQCGIPFWTEDAFLKHKDRCPGREVAAITTDSQTATQEQESNNGATEDASLIEMPKERLVILERDSTNMLEPIQIQPLSEHKPGTRAAAAAYRLADSSYQIDAHSDAEVSEILAKLAASPMKSSASVTQHHGVPVVVTSGEHQREANVEGADVNIKVESEDASPSTTSDSEMKALAGGEHLAVVHGEPNAQYVLIQQDENSQGMELVMDESTQLALEQGNVAIADMDSATMLVADQDGNYHAVADGNSQAEGDGEGETFMCGFCETVFGSIEETQLHITTEHADMYEDAAA